MFLVIVGSTQQHVFLVTITQQHMCFCYSRDLAFAALPLVSGPKQFSLTSRPSKPSKVSKGLE